MFFFYFQNINKYFVQTIFSSQDLVVGNAVWLHVTYLLLGCPDFVFTMSALHSHLRKRRFAAGTSQIYNAVLGFPMQHLYSTTNLLCNFFLNRRHHRQCTYHINECGADYFPWPALSPSTLNLLLTWQSKATTMASTGQGPLYVSPL